MEFPLCIVEKIEDYINDLYLLEHQTRFKLIFINEIHDKFIEKRIGQYKELIENLDYDINLENILHLKNTDDDIYVICSKNTKRNYELMISKIEDKLKDNGLVIKKFYYISETFYNRVSDDISYKKARLLLQHIVGFKTEGDKFIYDKIEKYNELFYYDDDDNAIKLSKESNKLLTVLLSNTDVKLKEIIKK